MIKNFLKSLLFAPFMAITLLIGFSDVVTAENLFQSGQFTVDIESLARHKQTPILRSLEPMSEILVNPGFETGSLPPWYSDVWTVVTNSPHSGTYCATDTGNYWIRQDFPGIPVEDISSITLWSRQPEEAIQAVYMMYSDATQSGDVIYPLSTWQQFDVTSFLTPGKILTGIQIWGYSGGGADPDITYIDDISIQTVTGGSLIISPPTGNYVTTQRFDLTLIVEAPGLNVTGGTILFNGSDITSYISNNAIRGSLAVNMGKTFRLPGLNVGSTLNLGVNTLDATLNLSDGSSVSNSVTWDVLENTEP